MNGQTKSDFQENSLPRSYGQIRLGMSVSEYQIITQMVPSQCDHDCAEGELSNNFFTDEAYGGTSSNVRYFPDAYLKYQPRPQCPRHVFAYFYKGKLYLIVLNGVFTILPYFRERYVKKLGPPTLEDKEGNEYKIASFEWENENTKLLVVHTAGDVWIDSVQVQYIDISILKCIPKTNKE